jgi:hypothetical protein
MTRRRGKLLLFWDYDTQWGGDRSRSPGAPKMWGDAEYANTDRLLELHAEYGVHACFAVVGAAALPGTRPYHHPDQIRRIHQAGHEVGSHSHRHEWLPGLCLEALRETLISSKDALEQCIGSPLVTFVPPYNQPFDCRERWSFSASERREARTDRTDLRRLCQTLKECGYRFSRVSYWPLWERLVGKVFGPRCYRPARLERLAGLTCLRLNTPCGFAEPTRSALQQCVKLGGYAVVYGHPHSLRSGNSQDESHLVHFLRLVRDLREARQLKVCLPKEILAAC